MNAPIDLSAQILHNNPFDLASEDAFRRWRDDKFDCYPASVEQLFVAINDPFKLSSAEIGAIRERVRRYNMAIYNVGRVHANNKSAPSMIAQQLGLQHLDRHLCVDDDGLSPIEVSDHRTRHDYIPYTNKPINWHTDGYYNETEHTIFGMLLHCVRPALSGGDNALIDHEVVYCLLRDENPDWIEALMQNDVMTIPPNIQNGEEIRAEQSGPVFSIKKGAKPFLHMRYTARGHNIVWKNDPLVQSAVKRLREIMDDQTSPYIFRAMLEPGQGIICNNVLHKRTGFNDSDAPERKRLLYRARYYDRIQ